MQLVNTTPLVAKVSSGTLLAMEERPGIIVAKGTFDIRGEVLEIDDQDPYPLLDDDVATDLGLIPRDDLPRLDDGVFEVALLGAAWSKDGCERMTVALDVGGEHRELVVTGNRSWVGDGDLQRISPPEAFTRMPLTWRNAFGGRCDVEIDEGAWLMVQDHDNPEGKGFDQRAEVDGLVQALGVPEGYPRYDRARRLPNVEHPGELIARPGDKPRSASWAPVPMTSGIHAARTVAPPVAAATEGVFELPEILAPAFHRAAPGWVISTPPPGSRVTMSGLHPDHPVISFTLPSFSVVADYECGKRTGALELTPQFLMLFPELLRCYVVWRRSFTFAYDARDERSMRLRMQRPNRDPRSTKDS